MTRYLAIILVLLLELPAWGQTNVVYDSVTDYGGNAITNNGVLITLISPNPRVVNGNTINQNPIQLYTDVNGYAWYTNLPWGKYRLEVAGNLVTPFIFYVGTNTTGLWNLALLVTNANAVPTNWWTPPWPLALTNAVSNGTGGSGSVGVTNQTVYITFPAGGGGGANLAAVQTRY